MGADSYSGPSGIRRGGLAGRLVLARDALDGLVVTEVLPPPLDLDDLPLVLLPLLLLFEVRETGPEPVSVRTAI